MRSAESVLKRLVITGSIALVSLVLISIFALRFDQVGADGSITLYPSQHIYDANSSLSVSSLSSIAEQPSISAHDTLPHTPRTEGRHWLVYSLEDLDVSFDYIKVETAWLDEVTAYFLNTENQYYPMVAGDNDTFTTREVAFRKPVFPLLKTLNSEPVNQIVFSVSAQGYFSFPVVALSKEAFQVHNNLDHLFYGAWLSILFALGAYNAVLFFTLRDGLHIYYSAYILSYAALLLIASGMAQQYLWPTLSNFTTPAAHVALALTNFTTTFFAARFMGLNHSMPVARIALVALAYLSIALIPLTLVFNYAALSYMLACSFAIMAIVFMISVRETARGNPSAPFLLASYVVLVPSNAIALMRFMGLYEGASWAEHLAELGLLVEAGILSFGIAYRVGALKQEKDQLALEQIKERENFSKQLIELKEDERRSIGKALHDSLGHKILSIKSIVQRLNRTDSLDSSALNAVALLDETLDEVRDLSQLLYPSMLEHLGLAQAITALARRSLDPAGINYTLGVAPINIEKDAEILLYRAAQESMSNAIKHGNPSDFTLAIRYCEFNKAIVFEASDNGENKITASQMGFGLTALSKHVSLMDGALNTRVTEHNRNTVEINLPLNTG